MLSEIVTAGQIVEMEAVNKTEEGGLEEKKVIYRTKVFDVLSEDQLEIMMPLEKGQVVLLPVDGEYNLFFYTEKGLYQCYVRISDRYKSNNVYIVAAELTSNLRKHQRREYYRFNSALVMNCRPLEEEEIEAAKEEQFFLLEERPLKKGVIVDISGGGIRFISTQKYEAETVLYCEYVLNMKGKEKPYNLVGKVLSVKELEKKPGTWEHRVQFINIDEDIREEIIKYIFEEERRQRHKVVKK
ncbi:MAG: flagellar brake protein [Lachnospiraceae bacterium]|nr:flagellar brake protein [Lachnospiraceae bacterium]